MMKGVLAIWLCIVSVFLSFAQDIRLGMPLGHTEDVNTAVYSPDGKYVVTASVDKLVKIWESGSGLLINTLEGKHGKIKCAQFSPDGIYIAAAGDSLVKIWETATGKPVRDIRVGSSLNSVQFSPDGKLLAIGLCNSSAEIRELSTGKLVHGPLRHQPGWVNWAEFSPPTDSDPEGGKYLLTASDDDTAGIWDVKSGIRIASLDAKTPAHKLQGVKFASFSRDGNYIVTASKNGTAQLWSWNGSQASLLKTMQDSIGAVQCAQFTPDGRYIAIAGDSLVQIWARGGDQPLVKWKENAENVRFVQFSPDCPADPGGAKYLLVALGNGLAKIRYPDNGDAAAILSGKTNFMYYAGFSPPAADDPKGGQYIISASLDGTAKVWAMDNGQLRHSLEGHSGGVRFVQYSPDGKFFVTASMDSTMKIWESGSGRLLHTCMHHGEVNTARFSPDGKYIVTASIGDEAMIWQADDGRLLNSLKGHISLVSSASFSPDGKYIVTASRDNLVMIRESQNGRPVDTLKLDDPVNDAQYSPDGKYIITADDGGKIKIWEAGKNIPPTVLIGHTERVNWATYSPDGKKILTASKDATVRIWDAGNHKLIDSLTGHSAEVYSAVYSPDEKMIVTASADGSFILWDGESHKEILRQFVFGEGEYVTLHPSGLFDATPGAMRLMYWVKGMEVIAFEQLKDHYWEPGLWDKVMQGETLKKLPALNELKLHPEIQLDVLDQKELQITLTKRDGGYGNVEVYINGKEVTSDARGGGFDPGDTVEVVSYDLQNNPYLIPGAVNTITVKTQSEDGLITSKGAETLITPKGPAPKLDTSFFAVICGVNDYRNPNMRLRYGQPDALAISAAVKRGAKNLFGSDKTFIYTLTSPGDSLPTKENIWKVFREIAQKAKPQDILLLYFSGHGILWGKNDSVDFYYLPQNAASLNTAAYNNDSVRWNNTVSARELIEWIKVIPTHMQALVFDACASGKATNVFWKSSDLIIEKAGVFLLGGCADSASSYESNRYEHGILTYSLLKVMKDNKWTTGDKIDVEDWLYRAKKKTPGLAKAINRTQEPQFYNVPGAEPFNIGKLEGPDLEAIKIPEGQ